jgi:DNA-binding HxlR family transcriptional regulator
MALLDLLGRRWALRILWELRQEPATFRSLRERCDAVSPSVLNLRLSELRAAGIVRLDPANGYGLTQEGDSLIRALAPLSDWARRWERRATRE